MPKTYNDDPHYADVIVARWEKMTGLKALKVNSYAGGGGTSKQRNSGVNKAEE